MGEYVLIIVLLAMGQPPAISHVYFASFFGCERARTGLRAQIPFAPNLSFSAECYETNRDKP